jgi:hypothetical protein
VSATRVDDKGKTLPLPVDVPAPREARSTSRSFEDSADTTSPIAKKASSGMALWLGLAAVVVVAGIWMLSRPSEEAAKQPEPKPPEPAAAQAEPVAAPAEPVAAPVAPQPAAPSSAAPPDEPKIEKQAEVAPEPAPTRARPAPAPAPAPSPPPAAPVKVESSPSKDSDSLSPALAARVAISKNSLSAERCRQKPDPAGTAQAVVTFAPSGQVTAARVVDQYAGTHTAACVEERLKQVTMDGFSGESVTVRVPIQLY